MQLKGNKNPGKFNENYSWLENLTAIAICITNPTNLGIMPDLKNAIKTMLKPTMIK